MRNLLKVCVILALQFYSEAFGFRLTFFDFQSQSPSSCKPEEPNCVTTHQLVEHALKHSYESREKIETLFQARTRTRELSEEERSTYHVLYPTSS